MNDIDRACAAFRTLLEEQQARVAGMTAEQVDYTNKATVTIGFPLQPQGKNMFYATLHGGDFPLLLMLFHIL